jgi:hypothetical protein
MTRRLTTKSFVALSVSAVSLFVPLIVAADDVMPSMTPAVETGPAGVNWCLPLPTDGKVNYRGVVDFDQVGTSGGAMLYPAPNVIGFLAAVVTHGVLVESAKNGQKEKLQAEANKVLQPYQDALDHFDARDLMQRALKRVNIRSRVKPIEQADDPGQNGMLKSTPVFSLTQDQKAIILDNTIGIQSPGAAETTRYQKSIRVVSEVKEVDDLLAYWSGNNGEKLKDESAQLVAESIDIALNDVNGGSSVVSSPYRTVRFREGTTEKIERAQVLSAHCERLLIRTLRGQLMSVPTSRTNGSAPLADGCVTGESEPN